LSALCKWAGFFYFKINLRYVAGNTVEATNNFFNARKGGENLRASVEQFFFIKR